MYFLNLWGRFFFLIIIKYKFAKFRIRIDAFIGIQAMSYNDRYFNRIHKGFGQVQDTLESYFD